MTKDQALQLLKNLEEDEKEKRQELQRRFPVNSDIQVDKDW
ncbi:MAG: hypothetical protein ACE15F_23575 [bacterium]